jgi:3-deoxy-manno-octulosonate cytidylyltransferase (CMP-KDO synthetase)
MPALKRILGVIPARLASTRLPEKVLAEIGGRPLLWHVYHSASRAKLLSGLVVAADDKRIVEEMTRWKIPCVMTSKDCASGTERVAEVARKMKADAYVNIQGDEPFMPVANIDRVCRGLSEGQGDEVVTLCVAFQSDEDANEPGNVKVVFGRGHKALYFSRSLIPFDRNGTVHPVRYKHLGIYGYGRATLLGLLKLPSSRLEKAEKLEQLGFLENGVRILVYPVKKDSTGVDTPADLDRARKEFRTRTGLS